MIVPKEGPQGVELLADSEGGAWLTVGEDAPFWMFWAVHRRVTTRLDRFGLIWLYQSCAKFMRRGVVEQGFDELQFDLAQSISAAVAADQEGYIVDEKKVADLMRLKGWVKM